ncbi:hypothetical protein FQN60_001542 [Etheostoma spectabile]|uniref:Uncharacterized protein n=1 Tax=Etheostoma spectabile TaxID=54343 RepID=A0A5J5D0S0_9PERO|nr:hypothetical protein FQN60_001542 [Etheostoma spectabile]
MRLPDLDRFLSFVEQRDTSVCWSLEICSSSPPCVPNPCPAFRRGGECGSGRHSAGRHLRTGRARNGKRPCAAPRALQAWREPCTP